MSDGQAARKRSERCVFDALIRRAQWEAESISQRLSESEVQRRHRERETQAIGDEIGALERRLREERGHGELAVDGCRTSTLWLHARRLDLEAAQQDLTEQEEAIARLKEKLAAFQREIDVLERKHREAAKTVHKHDEWRGARELDDLWMQRGRRG